MFSSMSRQRNRRLVRCFVREDGGVEPEAVVCRIEESKPLVSGECEFDYHLLPFQSRPFSHHLHKIFVFSIPMNIRHVHN